MTFKVHKIIFFSEKNLCLPYLKFSDLLPETHFFIWPYSGRGSVGRALDWGSKGCSGKYGRVYFYHLFL